MQPHHLAYDKCLSGPVDGDNGRTFGEQSSAPLNLHRRKQNPEMQVTSLRSHVRLMIVESEIGALKSHSCIPPTPDCRHGPP